MGGLEDKIAIVTGAGQGIGQAIARKLAAEGATVVVTDLDEASAIQTADALTGAVAIRADVSDRQAVQAMADRVVQQFGRVDVLVNNAGWDKASPFVDSDPADWDRAIAINLYGVLHTCKAVLPLMAARGGGAVVNLGSDAGRVGSSGEAVYSAAKGGVIAFTKSLAREMARHQVRVNCVCPGPDRYRAVRVVRGAEAAGGPHQGDPVPAARPAGRRRQRRRVPRLGRGVLRHRPDRQRQRRPHDELSLATFK